MADNPTRRAPVSPTLALIIAGGLAAGIALARPAANPVAAGPAAAVEQAEGATGYGTPSPAPAPARPEADAAPAQDAVIRIKDFAFEGALTVSAGQRLMVINQDTAPHTLTLTDGGADTGTIAGGGSAFITAPATAGTYAFFCEIHPSMQGELIVTG